MNKKIIIKEFNNNLDSRLSLLNQNSTDCIICCCNDISLFLMINKFCSCYDYVLICEKCFIKWLFQNNNCFVCRNKFVNENNNRFMIFDIRIDSLYTKILIKVEEMYIPRDNLEIDRTLTRTGNFFRNNDNRVLSFYRRNIDNIHDFPILYICFVIFTSVSVFCIVQYVFIKF